MGEVYAFIGEYLFFVEKHRGETEGVKGRRNE